MNFIEVCAGAGGLSSGFIKAGFNPILLNDNDKTCCDTLKLNHLNVKIICDTMCNLDLKKYYNKIDVLMGGIPCQSWSVAGQRKGLDDERGNLLLEFKKLINDVNPKIFLIENVKGLLSHDKGISFKKVIKNLDKVEDGPYGKGNKYDLYWKVLNAVDYLVPQKRERIFIIGVRKDIEYIYKYPKPKDKKIVLKDVLLDCPKSDGYTYSEYKKNIMKMVPQGGCWIDLPLDIQKEYLGNAFYSGGGKRGMAKRLSMNEPCLTLTTSPNQKQTERAHPIKNRPLTIREYARIQTFDDDYEFTGSISNQYKQIGNAVPVKLAYYIAKSIKKII